jgi:hypothetical protein
MGEVESLGYGRVDSYFVILPLRVRWKFLVGHSAGYGEPFGSELRAELLSRTVGLFLSSVFPCNPANPCNP